MKMLVSASVVLVSMSMVPVAVASEPGEQTPATKEQTDGQQIDDYWLDGEPEITRYNLVQARHGELHPGNAVLIFEVRHFLPDQRVETESPDWKKMGAVEVLRLNFTKEFSTGVDPYSIMTSVYTPLRLTDRPGTLASVTSIQQWPGQEWLELDLAGDAYEVTGRSFESGASEVIEVEATWLEDEIWTRIRLAPSTLPTGMVSFVPGSEQALLRDRPLTVETARVSLEEQSDGVMVYAIRYPKLNRKLAILFEKTFPHAILGWDEWYQDKDNAGSRNQTTKATRAESIRLDYRSHTGNDDAEWRSKLGLD